MVVSDMSEKRDIQADRAMCEAATKGPWKYVAHPIFGENSVRQDPVDWNGMGYQHICVVPAAKGTFHEANGRFIAESREALPHYIARAEEAESALSHERRKVDAAVEYMTHGTNGFEHGICGLCPLGPNTDCRAITATDCKRLVHDYLDAKAKEGAK